MASLRARAVRLRAVGLRKSSEGRHAALEMTTGEIGGLSVVMVVTGDGARNAREGIASAFAALPVRRVIGIGVAGALTVDLAPGAVVVGERVLGPGAPAHTADGVLVGEALLYPGARRGVVLSADHIVDTVVEKQRMLQAADCGPLAAVVDLESVAYAGAATRAEIPWVVLRAVSDTAGEGLPALLNRCRDEGGAVSRGKVALQLLREPGALPALLSLRQRVRQCADVLADATELLLRSCPDRASMPAAGVAPAYGGLT